MNLTLWKNGQRVDIPLGNGADQARRGRNVALFTRRNFIGWAMYARGSREHAEMKQNIMSYIQQGFRPDPNDMNAKQVLMDLGIAY